MQARRSVRLPVLLCAAIALAAPRAGAYVVPHLRLALTESAAGSGIWFGWEQLFLPRQLQKLYSARGFRPLWVNEQGLSPAFRNGLQTLQGAQRHGLDPDRYHLSRLRELMPHLGPRIRPAQLAEVELLLSDGLLRYGQHLSRGAVQPSQLHPEWVPKDDPVDLCGPVLRLAEHGESLDFERELAPPREVYWRTLEKAQRLAEWVRRGGWPAFEEQCTLRPGDRALAVTALRSRLRASDDLLLQERADLDHYDTTLEEAVRRFQRRHGLEADGVVGPSTRQELQISAAERRQKLLLTLERLRWLPRRWRGRTLVVNVADFALEAWQDDELILEMRTIVGTRWQKTPVLRERLERVEINPYWKVPLSIAVQELLPKIRQDCGYLEQNGFELVTSYADSAEVLDPTAVDWEAVGWRNFPGRIRQCPGPDNALGRIKFLFPNELDVYLHDTPQRQLFSRSRRTLSHGCVRVEQPITLAHYVLQDHPDWSAERIDEVIASGERHVVDLRTPGQVYLLYWTGWADAAGHLQFRRDVYGRDAILQRALFGDETSRGTAALEPVAGQEGRAASN